ncbi:MAG: hypothetical protein F6K17_20470 [Okeania sp. SIO3C4]|nr:hypothetical protein [Okeania sp. SIO3B3]NER04802.1 hypothetical protein [Okeania sp. SIO3C4]
MGRHIVGTFHGTSLQSFACEDVVPQFEKHCKTRVWQVIDYPIIFPSAFCHLPSAFFKTT